MKLTAQLKLQPSPDQADALKRTLEAANTACNSISQVAWETRTFGTFALQKLCYQDVRQTFGLSAQMTIRTLAKVADAYKLDKQTKRTFRPLASIAYDDRILSFALPDSSISIWTLDGRQTIRFVTGVRQMQLLQTRMGETDLVYHRGDWYLLATCEVQEPDPHDVDDVLGIDLGVTNIATDSDGTIYSGGAVKGVRYRQRRLRNKLQKKRTLSAKRRLRKLSGQEARFAKDVNHTISKRIVREAQRTKRAIALENLKDIRTLLRARKSQRTVLHSWSFFQLQACIGYKAALVGLPVVLVDPRNTSRTCPACGHVDKANRSNQSTFRCVSCGCAGHADTIAAENIRVLGRAAVIQPYVSEADGSVAPGCPLGHKPPPLDVRSMTYLRAILICVEVSMETQNVTLSLPKDVLLKVKLIAVQRNMSVSSLLTQALETLVQQEDAYAQARRRHLQWLEHGADLGTGGRIATQRDDLHERR